MPEEPKVPQLSPTAENLDMLTDTETDEELEQALNKAIAPKADAPKPEESKEESKEEPEDETEPEPEEEPSENLDDLKKQLAAQKRENQRLKLKVREERPERDSQLQALQDELNTLKGQISKEKEPKNEFTKFNDQELKAIRSDFEQKRLESLVNGDADTSRKYAQALEMVGEELEQRKEKKINERQTQETKEYELRKGKNEFNQWLMDHVPDIKDKQSPLFKSALQEFEDSPFFQSLGSELGTYVALLKTLVLNGQSKSKSKSREKLLDDIEEGIERKIHSPGSRTKPGKIELDVGQMDEKAFDDLYEKLESGELTAERKT